MNDRIEAAAVSDEQKTEILNKYGEMKNYLTVLSEVLAAKKQYDDVGFSIDEVHHKYDTFKTEVNQIFAQPPKPLPTPATEEPIVPDAEVQPDAEMKNEDEVKEEATLWEHRITLKLEFNNIFHH